VPARARSRNVESAALTAIGPVLFILPFSLASLFLFWLVLRLVVDVSFLSFALAYVAAGLLLFVRPVQIVVLPALLGARRPNDVELAVLKPAWREVTQLNHLPADRFVLRVLPSDELNAFACGGHLVVVTTFAVHDLSPPELSGVLAHELSHHLGLHTVALTIGHWLSIPIVLLARIGIFLQNVATAATRALAGDSAVLTGIGTVTAAFLTVASWFFVAALTASDGLANAVGRDSEYQADRRAVRMGYGRQLASALRRVIASGGGRRPIGWRERLVSSHPPARTRVARIEAMLRHPTRR
jgi:Zn-dependent protease with chaperone function